MKTVSLVKFNLTTGESYCFPVVHAPGHPFVAAKYFWCWEGQILIQKQEHTPVTLPGEALDLLNRQWGLFCDFADARRDLVSETQFQQALELYHETADSLYKMGDV